MVTSPRTRAVVALVAATAVVAAGVGALVLRSDPASTTSWGDPVGVLGPVDLPPGAGPFEVTRARYDLGDEVFLAPGFESKIELAAVVHHPTRLAAGPFPIVLFMHGYHFPCFSGADTIFAWPCPDGYEPLPHDAGYDYIAERLASWGFIVASVSANGLNVRSYHESDDTGIRERGELFEAHLDLWSRWNDEGGSPFGRRFVGEVDLTHIGTMGHSRAGEGAIWHVLVDRERPRPYGIDAVLAIAPTDLTGATLGGVPFGVVIPTCDGDLDDLQGIRLFERARDAVRGDLAPKHLVTMVGANHKFFNSVWSPGSGFPDTFDDTIDTCSDPLTQEEQRRAGASYVVSFFRRYVGGDEALDAVWTGQRPAAGAGPSPVLVTYHAPDTPEHRLDIDRFVSRAVLRWANGEGSVRFELPVASRDVSGFDAFQFRIAVDPEASANDGIATQDLVVILADGAGGRAEVAASEVGNDALTMDTRMILNQVRFPLRSFLGVDLRDVRRVILDLSATPAGEVQIADVAFTSGTAS